MKDVHSESDAVIQARIDRYLAQPGSLAELYAIRRLNELQHNPLDMWRSFAKTETSGGHINVHLN